MKTILIACVMTITISTAAMAAAVPELDTVSVVSSKNPDVFQVAGKSRKLNASKNDKEEAYSTGGAGKKKAKDKEEAYSTSRAGKKKAKDKEEAYRTGGRADFQDLSIKRKPQPTKRKSPSQ